MIHARLMNGERLTQQEAAEFMDAVMQGEVSSPRLAAALAALRVRGETTDEIAGFAQSMRQHAVKMPLKRQELLLDIVGTGGDGANTFNISTTAAFVVASGGVTVAKHGNRAASARSGSADVLEALGVNLEATPERVAAAIEELGVGFMFARNFHPALRHAAGVRSELAARTVFNILGPISNPADASHHVMGVYSPQLTHTLAEVMQKLEGRAALVVCGASPSSRTGLDELTVTGESTVSELKGGVITDYTVTPEELGLSRHPLSALVGGDAAENAEISRAVLQGKGTPAQQDVVALNAGAGLYIAGKTNTLAGGVALAQELMRTGKSWDLLVKYREFTHGG